MDDVDNEGVVVCAIPTPDATTPRIAATTSADRRRAGGDRDCKDAEDCKGISLSDVSGAMNPRMQITWMFSKAPKMLATKL
jgi:hypothetical protein